MTLASGSPINPAYPDRVATNLINGVYGYALQECYLSNFVPNPYILVDLQIVKPIDTVIVRGQNSSNIAVHFQNIEVRIGNVSSSGDFSEYSLLGTFVGPTNITNLEVQFGLSTPSLYGRFVSVQMMVPGGFQMQVCKLDIY